MKSDLFSLKSWLPDYKAMGSSPLPAAFLLAVVYYLAAKIGLALRFPNSPISALWPPNALVLAILLITPARTWWLYLLAVIPAHLAVYVPIGVLPAVMATQLFTNDLQIVLAAAGMRYLSPDTFQLRTLRQTTLYILVAVITVPCLTAIIMAGARVLAGWSDDFWLMWRTISLSNVLPFLTLTPAVALWLSNGRVWLQEKEVRHYAEAGLLAVGLLTISSLVFGRHFSEPAINWALMYAPLPFLLWIAVRFRAGGVTLAIFTVIFLAAYNAIHGYGPFEGQSPTDTVLALQISAIAVTTPLLLLATLIEERRTTALRLHRLNSELEQRVAIRTAQVQAVNESLAVELREQQRLVDELQTALTKVNQLEGILPICSFCKKIRGDDGQWQTVEAYISHHSEAKFSHTFCSECARENYADYFDQSDDF